MKVLMITNTYSPHVGGVARSVADTSERLHELGHPVLVVCPSFGGTETTRNVLRVPAIEHFGKTDFSFPLPIPIGVHRAIDEFSPDVIHSHHPFLLGDTALRVGADRDIPVVFTHHTQYDQYAHYLGGEKSTAVQKFINKLDIGYCNLCDAIIAPSRSVADDLVMRNVTKHIEVIPTGINIAWWANGSKSAARELTGIPREAIVIGHVGRLAKEKNLTFLANAVAKFLSQCPNAWFVVAGLGSCEEGIQLACEHHGVSDRLLMFGVLDPLALRDLYHTFDVFAFASHSETQGIVLAEAMAAGAPVVAVDAPGVREIVTDRINGRLLPRDDTDAFVTAIKWTVELNPANRDVMKRELLQTVKEYSLDHSIEQLLQLYEWSASIKRVGHSSEHQNWNAAINRAEEEFKIWGNIAHAIGQSAMSVLQD